jgi:hypothetical protein
MSALAPRSVGATPPARAASRRRASDPRFLRVVRASAAKKWSRLASSDDDAPSTSSPSADHLPRCVGTVTRVDGRGQRHEFYVVGTVHTPGSASADEVRAVIERVRPDAVVLELDQERLDAVVATAMHAETSASDHPDPDAEPDLDQDVDRDVPRGSRALPSFPYALASPPAGYGADFLSGAVAAEAAGALVVLGDAKARSLPEQIRARLFASPAELADVPRLWRSFAHLSRALGLGARERPPPVVGADGPAATVRFSDAVAEDPGKLAPLRGPLALGALALAVTLGDALGMRIPGDGDGIGVGVGTGVGIVPGDGIGISGIPGIPVPGAALREWMSALASATDALASAAAVLAFSRASEVLLADRDATLARGAARAAAVSAALRRGDLRRVSFPFTPDADATAARARATGPPGVSCFTTRRPLLAGETRRLNLFEPRWLALMDRLADENEGELVGAELGCVLGVNRRYVSAEWLRRATSSSASSASSSPSSLYVAANGDRSADLVVEPWMRLARVTRVAEGRRAVTGARKLEVWIEGASDDEPGGFAPNVARITPHPAGYLVADVDGESEEETEGESRSQTDDGAPVRCVCVVGLAHCNGVVTRLAEMNLDEWR